MLHMAASQLLQEYTCILWYLQTSLQKEARTEYHAMPCVILMYIEERMKQYYISHCVRGDTVIYHPIFWASWFAWMPHSLRPHILDISWTHLSFHNPLKVWYSHVFQTTHRAGYHCKFYYNMVWTSTLWLPEMLDRSCYLLPSYLI